MTTAVAGFSTSTVPSPAAAVHTLSIKAIGSYPIARTAVRRLTVLTEKPKHRKGKIVQYHTTSTNSKLDKMRK